MCEVKGLATSGTEEVQDPTEEEAVNEGSNALVKFDIGEFVHRHRKIQLLLSPWIRFYETIVNIVRWKSPYVTLFWLVFSCFIAISSPVFFVIIPSCYILLIMLLNGIKKKGKSENKRIQRTIKKKAENNDLNVKATVEKQVKEDVKDFITLLVQFETVTEMITEGLEYINSILKWESFKASISFFLSIFLAIIVLCLVPLPVILVTVILSIFCLNEGFKPVAMQAVTLSKEGMKGLLFLIGLKDLFPSKTNRQISSSTIDEEEWYDADQIAAKTEQDSSDENDSEIDGDEGSSMYTKKVQDSSSILSQLADYRRKQKKLNSGKCYQCDVPFSSILKKRQYCRHCGESFCSKCCSHRVKRSVFGATAPAAYEETVLVCKPCFDQLMNVNSID